METKPTYTPSPFEQNQPHEQAPYWTATNHDHTPSFTLEFEQIGAEERGSRRYILVLGFSGLKMCCVNLLYGLILPCEGGMRKRKHTEYYVIWLAEIKGNLEMTIPL